MSQNDRSIGRAHPAGNHDEGLVDRASADCSASGVPRPVRAADEPAVPNHGHGAAVVSTELELLAAALPFLDAGLRSGDLVALSCPRDTVDLLARELGARASAVESEPRMSLLGARAPGRPMRSRCVIATWTARS